MKQQTATKGPAEVHIYKNKTVSEKERKFVENEFNAIGKTLLRFLKVGEERKIYDRTKEAILTENTMLPHYY